jgi:hypothetical protein
MAKTMLGTLRKGAVFTASTTTGRFALLAFAILLFDSVVLAQQKAPTFTVGQCRADGNQWWADIKRGDLKATRATLPFMTLMLRIQEMQICVAQDVAGDGKGSTGVRSYTELQLFYTSDAVDRSTAFIHRHNQWSQFLDEDKDGVRP